MPAPQKSSSPDGVWERDANGLPFKVVSADTPPADATPGYAVMCMWIDTTNKTVHFNQGTVLSADFDAVTIA